MLTDDVVELLDRQHRFLVSRSGVEFLVQLRAYIDLLRAEPRVDDLLSDLVREATDALEDFVRHDNELVAELVLLREALTERTREIPGFDDSDMQQPAHYAHEYWKWMYSFAGFDDLARSEASVSFPTRADEWKDETRAKRLIAVLDEKFRRARYGDPAPLQDDAEDQRPDLEDLHLSIGNLARRHEHAFREYVIQARTLPGLSYGRLARIPDSLNPSPVSVQTFDELIAYTTQSLNEHLQSSLPVIRKAVYAEGAIDDSEQRLVDELVDALKDEAARLHEELRRRLGTIRSHLSVVERFRARCQWHDRDRLRELADGSATPENDLTAEFARYLFDSGLSPITRPLTGDLEPDLLDPSGQTNMYVEAKQYARSARGELVHGVQQIWDTLGRLRGTPYEVHEAFCVIFRRSGPRYVFPDYVNSEGVRLYFRLIDIAPAKETGSRQRRRAVGISAEELLPVPNDESGANEGGGSHS